MLVDTSVLARTLQPHDKLYAVADRAIERLPKQGQELNLVAENLIELWVVATRPVGQNGLVAAMYVHGVSAVLTFDKPGFSRYPGIEVVHPVASTT